MRSNPRPETRGASLRKPESGQTLAATVVAVAVAAALAPTTMAWAQSAPETMPMTPCSIEAYARLPSEPRVRAAPRRTAATVGRLRKIRYDVDDIEGAYVTVVAIQNGWAKIAAVPASNEDEQPVPAGWVRAEALGLTLQTRQGFSAPTPNSPAIYRDDEGEIGRDRIQRVLGCSGEWLNLRITGLDNRPVTGWFRGACANQRTTCDGIRGD